MNGWANQLESIVTADSDIDSEFEARLRESSTLAFRVAYSVLRQREDAEDVAQEAFARAYREFRKLRDRDKFRAWLVRITWRLAIDRGRSDRRRAAREDSAIALAWSNDADHDLQARDRAARLWRGIDGLPEKLRIVIVLAAIEGREIREVAQLLGVPEGTVKSRLFLAREALAEKLRCLE